MEKNQLEKSKNNTLKLVKLNTDKINDVICMKKIKKSLSKSTNCYVLMSCTAPNKEGKIKVSLSYEGDEILASYLVDSAQKYIEDKILSNQKSL